MESAGERGWSGCGKSAAVRVLLRLLAVAVVAGLSFSLLDAHLASEGQKLATRLDPDVRAGQSPLAERLQLPQAAERVRFGRDTASSKTACLGGLAYAASAELPITLPIMLRTAELFKDYRLVIFENDSPDGTAAVMRQLHDALPPEQQRRVHMVSVTLNATNAGSGGSLAPSRFQKLAHYRNLLLDQMQAICSTASTTATTTTGAAPAIDADYLVLFDTDITRGWEVDGVASVFSYPDVAWAFQCAHGVVNDGQHWDTLALRTHGYTDPVSAHWIGPFGSGMYHAHAYFDGPELHHVVSCFGGLAVYHGAHVFGRGGCRYDEHTADCEHTAFHQCVSAKAAPAPAAVNPLALSYYGVDGAVARLSRSFHAETVFWTTLFCYALCVGVLAAAWPLYGSWLAKAGPWAAGNGEEAAGGGGGGGGDEEDGVEMVGRR